MYISIFLFVCVCARMCLIVFVCLCIFMHMVVFVFVQVNKYVVWLMTIHLSLAESYKPIGIGGLILWTRGQSKYFFSMATLSTSVTKELITGELYDLHPYRVDYLWTWWLTRVQDHLRPHDVVPEENLRVGMRVGMRTEEKRSHRGHVVPHAFLCIAVTSAADECFRCISRHCCEGEWSRVLSTHCSRQLARTRMTSRAYTL